MQLIIGWIIIVFPGILYVAQIISSCSFSLAQKLGIQEARELADPMLQRAERYAAYWDLFTLGWLPLSGILMVVEHSSWPLIALFSSAIYLDAAGREAAKFLSFKHEGLKVGTQTQQRFFFATYIIMAILAIIVSFFSLIKLYAWV